MEQYNHNTSLIEQNLFDPLITIPQPQMMLPEIESSFPASAGGKGNDSVGLKSVQ